MIRGTVTASREAEIELTVIGPDGGSERITAVIDTGFTGHLTLPDLVVQRLNLPFDSITNATLADGSHATLAVHTAEVEWHNGSRPVLVIKSSGGVLAGMKLLYGSKVILNVIDGGDVEIASILP